MYPPSLLRHIELAFALLSSFGSWSPIEVLNKLISWSILPNGVDPSDSVPITSLHSRSGSSSIKVLKSFWIFRTLGWFTTHEVWRVEEGAAVFVTTHGVATEEVVSSCSVPNYFSSVQSCSWAPFFFANLTCLVFLGRFSAMQLSFRGWCGFSMLRDFWSRPPGKYCCSYSGMGCWRFRYTESASIEFDFWDGLSRLGDADCEDGAD